MCDIMFSHSVYLKLAQGFQCPVDRDDNYCPFNYLNWFCTLFCTNQCCGNHVSHQGLSSENEVNPGDEAGTYCPPLGSLQAYNGEIPVHLHYGQT